MNALRAFSFFQPVAVELLALESERASSQVKKLRDEMSDQCGWDAVNAWVAAHRDSLPRTLDELARYPMAYRRAIQGAVAPEVRAAFWCDHMRTFLGSEAGLSSDQRAAIEEAI